MRCNCEADHTIHTPRQSVRRGRRRKLKKSRQVRHYRESDDAHFWHWEDTAHRLVGNRRDT